MLVNRVLYCIVLYYAIHSFIRSFRYYNVQTVKCINMNNLTKHCTIKFGMFSVSGKDKGLESIQVVYWSKSSNITL